MLIHFFHVYVKNLCKKSIWGKNYISCYVQHKPYPHFLYEQNFFFRKELDIRGTQTKGRKKLRNNFQIQWNAFKSDQYQFNLAK